MIRKVFFSRISSSTRSSVNINNLPWTSKKKSKHHHRRNTSFFSFSFSGSEASIGVYLINTLFLQIAVFTFRSPAVHWIARTSSLNCLSCRNPYQTPRSLNCLPPFHWKALFFTEKCFVASPPPKSGLIHSFAWLCDLGVGGGRPRKEGRQSGGVYAFSLMKLLETA